MGKEQVPQGSSGALTIAKAQSWHSGQYRCMAFNSHGLVMTEATVEFKVEGNLIFKIVFASVNDRVKNPKMRNNTDEVYRGTL